MKPTKPEVVEVPDSESFANHLADAFLEEEGMQVDLDEGESVLDVVLSTPESHIAFTIWLCDLVRETNFDTASPPPNTLLN